MLNGLKTINNAFKINICNSNDLAWNATAWKRGSIVMILMKDFNFADIFKNTYRPGLRNSQFRQFTVSSKEAADAGDIGICFSASNGLSGFRFIPILNTGMNYISWPTIIARKEIVNGLFRQILPFNEVKNDKAYVLKIIRNIFISNSNC